VILHIMGAPFSNGSSIRRGSPETAVLIGVRPGRPTRLLRVRMQNLRLSETRYGGEIRSSTWVAPPNPKHFDKWFPITLLMTAEMDHLTVTVGSAAPLGRIPGLDIGRKSGNKVGRCPPNPVVTSEHEFSRSILEIDNPGARWLVDLCTDDSEPHRKASPERRTLS